LNFFLGTTGSHVPYISLNPKEDRAMLATKPVRPAATNELAVPKENWAVLIERNNSSGKKT
jgi:hypothetical protein